MSDFSDEDELPDISFTGHSQFTPGKCTVNKKQMLTPKIKQEIIIPTFFESALKELTDGLKEITGGGRKGTDISPQHSSPSFHHKNKWKRHSSTNLENNSPSGKSYISGMSPDISLTHTPPSSKKPPASLPHSPSSPSTSGQKTLSIGGSSTSNLAQRCFQRINGIVSTLNQAYRTELPQKENDFKLDETGSPSWNATNKSRIYSDLSPLSKRKKIDQISVTLQNRLFSSNDNSRTFQGADNYTISQENMSTPPTREKKSVIESISTPPSKKKKFGIESSPGSDLLERCLKKLGCDNDDLSKENIKDDNINNKKTLHGANNEILKLGSISDIKQHFSFVDNENIVNENELNIKKKESPRASLDVVNTKSNVGSILTKNNNLDQKLNVKSWNDDYMMESEEFHNETMLSIINETTKVTTKKSRCGCRNGDCSRKRCSCQRSGAPCASHCGCQSAMCKNRAQPKLSPASRKTLVPSFGNPEISLTRIKTSPGNMIKISVQTTSNSGETSPSGEQNRDNSGPKQDLLKTFRVMDSKSKNPVDTIKKTCDEISTKSTLNNKIMSSSPTDENTIQKSSDLPLKSLRIQPSTSPLKYLRLEPRISTSDGSIFDFERKIEVPQCNNKVVPAEISNESSTSYSPLKYLRMHPSTSTSGVTIFESRIESPQSESSNVPTAIEFVDSNSLSDNESSTFVNESRLEDKAETSVDVRGNPVVLIPESLTFLRNTCDSVANPDNESTIANSSNDLSVDIQTGTMQESSTSLSRILSSLSNTEILETSLNSYTGNLLDETVPFKDNLLDETVPYNSNLLDETIPYTSNLLEKTVPFMGNLLDENVSSVKRTESNKKVLEVATSSMETERIKKPRPSSDDLGYASDIHPPIKKIKIEPILFGNVKKEVDTGKSWDQLKQEGEIKKEVDQVNDLNQIQLEINSNSIETPGPSLDSWHKPHTTRNPLPNANPAQVEQEPSSPVCIKKEVHEILPGSLVKVLLGKCNMKETKANLLNVFHPEPLNKVINENPNLFKVHLCLVADCQVILAPTNVSLCGGHSGPDGCTSRATCAALHICTNFIGSKCLDELCVYGHSFYTNHNRGILKTLHLDNVDADLLCKLLKSVINISEPKALLDICKDYNMGGCANHKCNNLHVCLSLVIGKCKCSRVNCSLNHNILNDKCRELLSKAGIDTNETPRDVMVALLSHNSSISQTILEGEKEISTK